MNNHAGGASASNDRVGAWQPIEMAPASGLIWLAVEADDGERRTFAAEASHEHGGLVWMVTTGWGGWNRLHSGWKPILWQRPPQAPNVTHEPPRAAKELRMNEPVSREVCSNAGLGAGAEAIVYCYSTDETNYFGDYSSRDDALAAGTAALEGADEPGETRTVWTGVQRHAMHFLRSRAADAAQSFAAQMEEWLCDDIVSDDQIVVVADAERFGNALLDLLQQHARFDRWAVDNVQEHEVIVPGDPEAPKEGV
jgi:hypothetical protein